MEEKLEFVWERWLIRNMVVGTSPERLKARIIDRTGISEKFLNDKIEEIRSSVAYGVALSAYELGARREWLLRSLDNAKKFDPSYLTVKKIDAPEFKDFVETYYAHSKPVVLKNAMNNWPLDQWNSQTLLKAVGGETVVEVMTGRDETEMHEQNMRPHKSEMNFSEFIKIMEEGEGNNTYITANSGVAKNDNVQDFVKANTADIGNGYLDMSKMNLNHLWVGPKGTRTNLHYDMPSVLLAQLEGRKKVKLIPNMQVPYIYNNKTWFSDIPRIDSFDKSTHPMVDSLDIIEVILEEGEVLFIPAAWWHEVESLTPSISYTVNNLDVPNNPCPRFPMGGRSFAP